MKRKEKILSRSRGEISITREIAYIISRAQEHDSRVVRFGGLVLFSTDTGDAWLLDPEDHLALCLAHGGVEQDYTVVDTAKNYQIYWNAQYDIEGETFTIVSRDGRISTIMGYPTQEIAKAANAARYDHQTSA